MATQTLAPELTPPAASRPRLAYIDNLRIALTVMVVLHHVALTYSNLPMWYYHEPPKDASGTALDLFMVVNQLFFMGFFFMISGFFTPGSFDRKGPRSFWRDRLVRLGIPLLLFVLLVRVAVTLPIFVNLQKEVPYWLFYIVSWDPGPMWFVEVLLVFCLGYLLLRRLRSGRETSAPETQPQSRLPGVWAIIGFILGLSLVSYLWRIVMPAPPWAVVGLPSPELLPQYLGLFIVGVYAYRRGWFARISSGAMWSGLTAAILGLLVFLVTFVLSMELESQWHPLHLFSGIAESTFAVGIILFAMGLFQRRFDRQGPLSDFLSQNAFAVYFIHPLVLLGMGYALSGWETVAVAKFAVGAAVALPACWLVAWGIRALPKAKQVF